MWQYPLDPSRYINFFETILSWPVIHLVVPIGVLHISLWPQEIQPREREGWFRDTAFLCIRRLTLTCIFREISTKPRGMLTHLDWSSLTTSGPYLMPTGLFCCPLSTPDCLSVSPFANSNCGFLFPTPLTFPCPLPVASRSRAQAFVWFRAKTNKKIVCLAHHLHSVTGWLRFFLISNSFNFLSKYLKPVPSDPTTIIIAVTAIFHGSLGRPTFLSIFSFSFIFTTIIIIIICTPWEFFTSALTDDIICSFESFSYHC